MAAFCMDSCWKARIAGRQQKNYYMEAEKQAGKESSSTVQTVQDLTKRKDNKVSGSASSSRQSFLISADLQ